MLCRPSHLSAGWGGSSTLYNIPPMLCLCTPFSCIIFHMYSTVNVCCTYMRTDSSPFYTCTLNTQHTCTPNAHHTHTHTRTLHAHIHVRSFRMLEADVGRTPYPDYDIIVTKPLFSSAEEFTRYVSPAASQCLSSYWYYVHVRCLCMLVCTHAWW